MQEFILDYLKTQRVGVLAVEMLDGSPHAATVHFANNDEPLFFFETHRSYRKCEALFERKSSRASFVVGFDESAPKTLQLDGEVRLIAPEEKALFDEVYFGKFPEKKEKDADVFFIFAPNWWRFTDWTAPGGKVVINSEDHK